MSSLFKSAALSANEVSRPAHDGSELYRDSGSVRGSLAFVSREVKEKAAN